MAALREIRDELPVEPADVGVRPLGTTRYDQPVDDLVVAGRFTPDVVERAVSILERHGGSILVHRLELPHPRWPHEGTTRAGPTNANPAARVERHGEGRRATDAKRPPVAHARTRRRRPAARLRVRAARDRHIPG